MLLTGLAPDPRRPDYRLVEVDRGRFASLPADALAGLGLVVGGEIGPRVFARLQEFVLKAKSDELRIRLQKLNPQTEAGYDELFHELVAVDGDLRRIRQGLLDAG